MKLEQEILPNGAVKPLRKLEDVMKEYSAISHEVAQLHYQIFVHNEELGEKFKRMKDLNKEGAIIQKFAAEKKEGESDVTT